MIELRTCRETEQSEARVTKRYPIAAQASFQWRGPDRLWYQGTGMTQDISASGALILAHEAPPLGAEVEVMVMFPAVRNGGTAKGCLSGKGTVVRLIDSASFAAAVTFHILKAGEVGGLKRF